MVISESMERALTLRERLVLKLHLWACVWCQWYLEHLHSIRANLQAGSPEVNELSSLPGLAPETRERLKKTLGDS